MKIEKGRGQAREQDKKKGFVFFMIPQNYH
jgi:hypothetical protein